MSNFPRLRNHRQYTDIENLKKYEARTCIAYELAIRNPKVIELVENAFRQYIDNDMPKKLAVPTIDELCKLTHSGEYFKELRDNYFMPQDLYLNYHFFCDLWEEKETLINQDRNYHETLDEIVEDMKKNNREATEEEWTFFKSGIDIKMLPFLIFDNKEFYLKEMMYRDSTVFKILERKTANYHERFYHLENEEEEKITSQVITPVFARPQLKSFHKIIERDIRVNLALPKKELLSFLKVVKNDFDNKKNFVSVEELFQETFKEDNTFTYSQKRLANMFFIYDYVTFKLKYSGHDDPLQIIRDEASFLIKNIGSKHDTIRKDYNKIDELIKNCKYKSLI